MQKNIHPKYELTKFVANNGVEFYYYSCLGSQNHLAVDAFTHPAWTREKGAGRMSNESNRISKYEGINNI